MRQRLELQTSATEDVRSRAILSLRDVVRVGYRRRFQMSVFFLATILAMALFMFLTKKTYISESILLLRLGRENSTLDTTARLGQTPVIIQSDYYENEINSVAEILRSRALLEEVVDRIGPATLLGAAPLPGDRDASLAAATSDSSPGGESDHPGVVDRGSQWWHAMNPFGDVDDRERAIQELSNQLRVEAVPHSNIIEVTYRAHSPQMAQAIVAKLVDRYLEEHMSPNRTGGTREFLSQQASQLKTALTAAEKELRELMNEKALVSSGGRRDSLDRIRSSAEETLRETLALRAASEAQVRELSAALASLPKAEAAGKATDIGDYGTDLLRGQLYALVLREKELASKYTDKYDELRNVRAQIQEVQKTIGRESRSSSQETNGAGRSREEIRLALLKENANLASLSSKVATLNQQVTEIQSQIVAFNDSSFRMRALEREVDLRESEYRKYSEVLEQAKLDEVMEIERAPNVSVVQPATFEPVPSFPRPWICLLAGFGVGICGAIALAYYLERGDTTLVAARDVEDHIGLPLLGVVPILQRANGVHTKPSVARSSCPVEPRAAFRRGSFAVTETKEKA